MNRPRRDVLGLLAMIDRDFGAYALVHQGVVLPGFDLGFPVAGLGEQGDLAGHGPLLSTCG